MTRKIKVSSVQGKLVVNLVKLTALLKARGIPESKAIKLVAQVDEKALEGLVASGKLSAADLASVMDEDAGHTRLTITKPPTVLKLFS